MYLSIYISTYLIHYQYISITNDIYLLSISNIIVDLSTTNDRFRTIQHHTLPYKLITNDGISIYLCMYLSNITIYLTLLTI
jgi:hypothetical protein